MVSAKRGREGPLFDLDNTKPYEKEGLIAAVGVSNEDSDSALYRGGPKSMHQVW